MNVELRQLKLLIDSIVQMDKVIRKYYRAQSDSVILDSLQGAGPQLAPRLMAAMESNRNRYQNAAEIQKYSGVAPVIERSGKNHGLIGGTVALSFYDKHLSSGLATQLNILSGQKLTIIRK
jgi:hypothetical protein